MSYTKYKCEITGKTFDQKSHIDKHLKSKTFKQQAKIKILELEKIKKSKLKKKYGTSKIDQIIEKIKCVKIKLNTYELVKQKKIGTIYYQLNKKQKKMKTLEKNFKNEFKNKLKRWHNMLSGCGVTGDPAFDDIINILIICYLESRISNSGKYDFLNLDKYNKLKQNKIKNYLESFNIEYIKNNTNRLTKSNDEYDAKPIFSKIGFILSNHPLTKLMYPSEDFINCNKDNILAKLISEIYEYSKEKNIFNYQDLVGIAYEYWLNEYQGNSGKELGNYFTERDLMLMTFQLLDKKDVKKYINNDSSIGDEFCGTFGYPLYLKQFLKENFNIKIKDKNIYGVEIGERHSRLAMINAMFSLDDFNNVQRGDGFTTNVSEHLDLSVHNVPFGKRISYSNTKEHYENNKAINPEIPEFKEVVPINVGKCDAPIASQMVIYKTKHIGLCIIKDGQETTGTGKFIKYRKYFCDTCNVKKILKIPGGIFSSTGTKTICLYFVKGKQTENIEFLELNNDCDTITKLVKVSYTDLKNNNYSWNPNVYMIDEEFSKLMEKSSCELKNLGEICDMLNGYAFKSDNYLKSGDNAIITIKNINSNGSVNFNKLNFINKEPKYEKYKLSNNDLLIALTGATIGKIGTFISNNNKTYYLNQRVGKFIFDNMTTQKYFKYMWIYNNYQEKIINMSNGDRGNISTSYLLNNIQIPIPSISKQESCVLQLDLLNKRKKLLEDDKKMIDQQMKYYIENKIKKNIAQVQIKNLGDVCTFKNGKSITKDKLVHGEYPVIGGGKSPMGYHNEYNRDENTILCSQSGNYSGFISKYKSKIWASDCFSIIPKDNIENNYLYYYLKNIQNRIYKLQSGAGQPHVYSRDLINLQISIPSKQIQLDIIKYLKNMEKSKEINNSQITQLDILAKSILEQSYYSNEDDDDVVVDVDDDDDDVEIVIQV